jgi:hypothetical protein
MRDIHVSMEITGVITSQSSLAFAFLVRGKIIASASSIAKMAASGEATLNGPRNYLPIPWI